MMTEYSVEGVLQHVDLGMGAWVLDLPDGRRLLLDVRRGSKWIALINRSPKPLESRVGLVVCLFEREDKVVRKLRRTCCDVRPFENIWDVRRLGSRP